MAQNRKTTKRVEKDNVLNEEQDLQEQKEKTPKRGRPKKEPTNSITKNEEKEMITMSSKNQIQIEDTNHTNNLPKVKPVQRKQPEKFTMEAI